MVDFSKLNSEEFREEQHQRERVREEREAQAKKTLLINGPSRQNLPFEKLVSEEGKNLSKTIRVALEYEIREGVDTFVFLANSGFNMLAFLEVMKLKDSFPHLRMILIEHSISLRRSWMPEDLDFFWMWRDKVDSYIDPDELAKIVSRSSAPDLSVANSILIDYIRDYTNNLLLVSSPLENFSLSKYIVSKMRYTAKKLITTDVRFNNYLDIRYL